MTEREQINAPSLAGWSMAAAAGVFTFGIAVVAWQFNLSQAGFVAAVVFLVVGVILGLPWGTTSAQPSVSRTHDGDATVTPVAAPTPMAQPLMAPPAPEVTAPEVPAPVAPVEVAAPTVQATAAEGDSVQPTGLAAPRDGQADDLKKIEGIGPVLEKLCHELGIFHFDQIAAWGASEVAWMDGNLKGFKGRVTRDKWVAQAKLIGEVGMDEFLRRAKTNDY